MLTLWETVRGGGLRTKQNKIRGIVIIDCMIYRINEQRTERMILNSKDET